MWVALNYVFSAHWCQNIQYHSLLKCFWNPKAERHSIIKIFLWLFSELDFHCVASSSNFFSPVENSFSTVREFWFSLSLSLLKEGRRWGEEEEEEKKNVIFEELVRNIWYSIPGEVPCLHLLSTQCYPSGPLGIICWHVLVWIFWKVDAEIKIVVQKV